jgi:hypothetical protein
MVHWRTSSMTKYNHGQMIQVPEFAIKHFQSVPVNTLQNTSGFLLCFRSLTVTPDRLLLGEMMTYSYIHKKR